MIAIIAVINLVVLIKRRKKIKKQKLNWSHIAIIELIFLSLFMIWGYIRSFVPEISNYTEHFMNYGFINRLMHTDYLPAEDII